MRVRTFEAGSMAEALRQVKRELGREAVILHTRTMKRGGLLGIGGRRVVEVTASDQVSIVPPRMRRQVLGEAGAAAAQPSAVAEASSASGLLRRTYGLTPPRAAERPSPGSPGSGAVSLHAAAAAGDPPPADAADEADRGGQLSEEVRQIRSMVHHMMRRQAGKPRCDLPDKLFHQYLALLEQEVTEELAEEVIERVRAELSESQMNDESAVREAVGRSIARLIPAEPAPRRVKRPADGRPLTIALTGPTGVGKTTTLAKLAATFKLREHKRVGLVTIDTYRIAAVDQLHTYANIIGLPLHVAQTAGELREALRRCAGCDVVLIDTAGRSQRDRGRLGELRELLEVADPHEVHLVLSSTCGQHVMMEAVERFSRVRTDRIIFTKLDEAVSFGVLLNVARRVNRKLSYITTGQEVPHQIEPGRSDRLAGLILGEPI